MADSEQPGESEAQLSLRLLGPFARPLESSRLVFPSRWSAESGSQDVKRRKTRGRIVSPSVASESDEEPTCASDPCAACSDTRAPALPNAGTISHGARVVCGSVASSFSFRRLPSPAPDSSLSCSSSSSASSPSSPHFASRCDWWLDGSRAAGEGADAAAESLAKQRFALSFSPPSGSRESLDWCTSCVTRPSSSSASCCPHPPASPLAGAPLALSPSASLDSPLLSPASPRQSPPSASPALWRDPLVLFLVVGNFFIYVDRGVIPGTSVELAAFVASTTTTASPDTLLGLLQACFVAGLSLGSPCFGHAVHFLPPFLLLAAGLGVWATALLLAALAQPANCFALLVGGRLLSGVGEAAFVAIAFPFLASYAEKRANEEERPPAARPVEPHPPPREAAEAEAGTRGEIARKKRRRKGSEGREGEGASLLKGAVQPNARVGTGHSTAASSAPSASTECVATALNADSAPQSPCARAPPPPLLPAASRLQGASAPAVTLRPPRKKTSQGAVLGVFLCMLPLGVASGIAWSASLTRLLPSGWAAAYAFLSVFGLVLSLTAYAVHRSLAAAQGAARGAARRSSLPPRRRRERDGEHARLGEGETLSGASSRPSRGRHRGGPPDLRVEGRDAHRHASASDLARRDAEARSWFYSASSACPNRFSPSASRSPCPPSPPSSPTGVASQAPAASLSEETRVLLSRPAFICLSLSGASYAAVVQGLATFAANFLLALGLFRSELHAGLTAGVLAASAGLTGTALGGWLVDCCSDVDESLAAEDGQAQGAGAARALRGTNRSGGEESEEGGVAPSSGPSGRAEDGGLMRGIRDEPGIPRLRADGTQARAPPEARRHPLRIVVNPPGAGAEEAARPGAAAGGEGGRLSDEGGTPRQEAPLAMRGREAVSAAAEVTSSSASCCLCELGRERGGTKISPQARETGRRAPAAEIADAHADSRAASGETRGDEDAANAEERAPEAARALKLRRICSLNLVFICIAFVLLAGSSVVSSLWSFLLLQLFGLTSLYATQVGGSLAQMLSVPQENRFFAIAASILVVHTCGDIPFPIAVGYVKDWQAPACAQISPEDGASASCRAEESGVRRTIFFTFVPLLLMAAATTAAKLVAQGPGDPRVREPERRGRPTDEDWAPSNGDSEDAGCYRGRLVEV
ncbi:hypothetical protein BESB_056180 [Besnoitia besnoiti]|uniref:Transmembrane protein n=1 Tax=Besnoitia besnoiti TaxID=94643 RepID=A0A2A9MK35_BESBE|nr:hypothetical protein BESB_056180 [Besnoitia besnoiti]PFH35967.1 hypothetical protein BESB_056180 [Besnoitia besnoiti]